MLLKGLLIYSCIVSLTNSQVLNKFINLQDWAIHEERIFGLVKDRIARLQSELVELEDYAKDYESTTVRHISGTKSGKGNNETTAGRAHIVASNALLIHAMSHRYAAKIPRIAKVLMKEDPEGDALKESVVVFYNPEIEADLLKSNQYRDYLPSNGDLQDALTSLSTLYEFATNVTPYNFAAKLSSDTDQAILITAYHATKISLSSFYHGMFGNAIDWILYADERTLKYSDDSISRDIVLYLRLYMIKMHNAEMYSQTKSLPVYLNFYTENLNHSIAHSVSFDKRRTVYSDRLKENELDVPPEVGYWVLCQGENLQTKGTKAMLKCYLDYNKHPYFTVSPLKVEVLSTSPKVLQIYDVLGENEITNLIRLIYTKISVLSNADNELNDEDVKRKPPRRTSTRIGNLTELEDIDNKVKLITGLASSFDRDSFQAHEHVPGKYEYVHNYTAIYLSNPNDDEGKWFAEISGDRLGTIEFYLKNVDEGGFTPFLNAKTFATPVRGSAIYREDMSRNGSLRLDSWRAECPVIRGHKLLLLKHFLYSEQFGEFQCSLNQQE